MTLRSQVVTLVVILVFVTEESRCEVSGSKALLYLAKYGYISATNRTSALQSEDKIKEYISKAVKDFQAFAGLDQTGELDPVTAELMETPRCGVKDIIPTDNADNNPIGGVVTKRRKKRYVLQGSRWRVNQLTYRVTVYPSTFRLSKRDVDDTVRKAFNMWQDSTGLTFEKKDTGSVHMEIRFEKYEHGDGDPFDGPGGTLAHAYFPQFGGDIHIDDTEYWSINSYKGTNLLQTMVHELGHSLGLKHSDVKNAIMAPFYRGWDPFLKLTTDDTKAIQSLYGQNKQGTSSQTTKPPSISSGSVLGRPGSTNPICSNPRIDSIFQTADKSSYIFRGDSYWKLTSDSVAPGYPRKIANDWPGLPTNIDAAFTWHKTKSTYFFKNGNYWKFSNRTPLRGYPKRISEGFPGIPDRIDTAFVWGGNGKIYFFRGGDYWKFDPGRKPHVSPGKYPKDVANWDLPYGIDAALQWNNGRTYFFKNGEYWRFNDRRFTIDSASPPFPRRSSEWWFGCPKTSTSQLTEGQDGIVVLEDDEEDVVEFHARAGEEKRDREELDYNYDYVEEESADPNNEKVTL